MATITLYELARGSRDAVIDLRAGSTVFQYIATVVGPFLVSDDQDLIAYVLANTSTRYGNQLRRTIDTKGVGGPVWMVTVTYGFDEGDSIPVPAGDPLPYEFSFDTTGGTQHITQSLQTVQAIKYGIPVIARQVNDLVTVGPRTVNDAVVSLGSATLTSATAAFTSSDVGAVLTTTTTGKLPVKVTIASVTNGTTVVMSSAALANGSSMNLTISSVILTSATAAFTTLDLGASVASTTANTIQPGATISKVISTTQVQCSLTLPSTQAAANLEIGPLQPVNYNRAIGVSRDGVAGTDVVAPKLEFQVIRNFVGMTLSYIKICHLLTGCQNDAPFYGFDAGELLFLGASGAPSQNNQAAADPLMRVTFRFAGSATLTNLDLVPDDANANHLLRIPEKRGWDYLWVFYKDDVDPVSNTMRPRPDAAYVEQTARLGDFSALGIGTS